MYRKYLMIFLIVVAIGATVAMERVPAIASSAAQQKSWPGAPASRLVVGGFGQVTVTASGQAVVPVRVREAPGTSGKVVGQLRDGMSFQVKEGPTCKDGYAWWHVVTEGLD